MDQKQWERVSEIVDTALTLEEEQRSTFINKECAENQDLRYQVTQLLDAIEQSETTDFLEGSDAFMADLAQEISSKDEDDYTSSLIGETIGAYKLIELIGHGGMGSVFLAQRADEAYDRKVAFKVLRRGMDTPSNIARFERERRILARLDHPNIARLLDGGVTEDGLPYLVMEYVDGTPLLQYCNTHRLSIEERLELFKSVCKAVQHAHRNATIHRDLKPSNIYVSNDGTVKVLDFGIAKLLESHSAGGTGFQTSTGARILTIGYAAPEQFESGTITTATDSYTLGIVLYELLTGVHPFDMKNRKLSKIEKLVQTKVATKPSVKFKQLPDSEKPPLATHRNSSPSLLIQELRGDLDAIVMKALRKEPEARYRSVDQMLKDLTRYEQSRPLLAQSDTLRYRLGKFLRRNRKAVAGTCLLLAAILGFGSYHIQRITEERNIAKAEARKAETVRNFLVNIFRSSNPRSTNFEGKDLSAKQLLTNGERQISDELKGQPDVYTEIMLAIGNAQKNIDAFEEAEKSYGKALDKSSETTNPIENEVRTHVKLGWLYTDWRRSQKKAHQHALEARRLLKQIENPSPTLEASVFSVLGRVISVKGHRKKGNTYFEKADSIYVKAGLQDTYDYIKMLTGYGRALLYVFDFEKSEQVLLKSNRLHRKKFDRPTLTMAENDKFIAWANREMGNFKRSNEYFRKSINLKRKLIGAQTVATAIPMYHLSRNYLLAGDFEKSKRLAKKVLHIYQKHLEPSNNYVLQAKRYVAAAKANLNKLAEAKSTFQELIKDYAKKYGNDDKEIANTASRLARVYQKTGRYQKAISLLKKCTRIKKRVLGEHSRGAGVEMLKLADAYRAKGEFQKAQQYFEKVDAIFQKELPDHHYRDAEFYLKYGKLERDMGHHQKARQYLGQAYEVYVDNFGKDSERAQRTEAYLNQIAAIN